MYTLVRCPTCGIQMNAPEKFAGLKITCGKCDGEINVPEKLLGRYRKSQWRKEKVNPDSFWKRNLSVSEEWREIRSKEVFRHNLWVVIGLCSLILLGLSPFLGFVSAIGGKSLVGVSGDGIIILTGTAFVFLFYLIVVLTDKFIEQCLLLAGAWGTLISSWMLSLIILFIWMKINGLSHAQSGIAILVLASIRIGYGVIVGLVGGVGLLISSSILQKSYDIDRNKIFLSHKLSVSIGVIILIGLFIKGSFNLFL